jgi:hypothetical protein
MPDPLVRNGDPQGHGRIAERAPAMDDPIAAITLRHRASLAICHVRNVADPGLTRINPFGF